MMAMATGCKSSRNGSEPDKEDVVKPSPKPQGPKVLFKFQNSPTLSAVLDRAEREKKPVFVDFYTTWCTPCKMMDEDVFTDKPLASWFNQNFISYKVDCEKGNGTNLATIYGVSNYPTLLFLDHRGSVLVRYNRAAYHTKLTELAEDAIAQYKQKFPEQ